MQALRTPFTMLSVLFTGLLCASGCDDVEATSDRYAAFTPALAERAPDPVAGMALALGASDDAVLELPGGEAVDLELGAAVGEDLLGACAEPFESDDRTLLPVLTRPLVVGERTFAEPVLEASCEARGSNLLVLREASDADCAAGECISFGAPEAIEGADQSGADALPFSAVEPAPEGNHCLPEGTRVCVSCGGGFYRPRTITSVFDGHPNQHCAYTYSYGACSKICED